MFTDNPQAFIRFSPAQHGQYYSEQNYCRCWRRGRDDRPCGRWNCEREKCREIWLRREKQRIWKGLEEVIWNGSNCFFVTLRLSNVNQPTQSCQEIKNATERLNAVLKELTGRLRNERLDLKWMRVFGVKSGSATSPHQIHLHALISHLPDVVNSPTPECPHRVTSSLLEEIAGKHDISVWIGRVYDPKGMANYFAKNLRGLNRAALQGYIDLPSGQKKLYYSSNWWKSDWQKQQAEQKRARRAPRRGVNRSQVTVAREKHAPPTDPFIYWATTVAGHALTMPIRTDCDPSRITQQFIIDIGAQCALSYRHDREGVSSIQPRMRRHAGLMAIRGDDVDGVLPIGARGLICLHRSSIDSFYVGEWPLRAAGVFKHRVARPPPKVTKARRRDLAGSVVQ